MIRMQQLLLQDGARKGFFYVNHHSMQWWQWRWWQLPWSWLLHIYPLMSTTASSPCPSHISHHHIKCNDKTVTSVVTTTTPPPFFHVDHYYSIHACMQDDDDEWLLCIYNVFVLCSTLFFIGTSSLITFSEVTLTTEDQHIILQVVWGTCLMHGKMSCGKWSSSSY